MAGNSRSGRKSIREEVSMKEVEELSVAVIKSALKASDVPKEDKIRIAIEIVKKKVVQKSDSNMNVIFNDIKNILIQGKEFIPKIGS